MTAGRDEPPTYTGAVQNWTPGSNVPVIVVAAPPAEPSVTRGVTGLFVPIFLAVFVIAAIYFFFGAWQAAQGLARQEAVTRDAAGLLEYMEDLERQNALLCASAAATPERVERTNLEAQVEIARRNFDAQCQRNLSLQERLSRRSGEAGSTSCPPATPAATTAPPRGESVDEFRARLCRGYQRVRTQ